MLELFLLRHAKSSRADPGLADYERPLTDCGAKAASEIGRYMRREELQPNLVVCSGAARARATLGYVLSELGSPTPEIRYDDALYHKPTSTMLEVLQKIEGSYRRVMMVGHNPELHALSCELVGEGKRKALTALQEKFPTSALAVVSFDTLRWAEVRSGSGRLERFVKP